MRTLNEKLDNQELTPYEFLLALAEVMGFDRMIDFIYHQGGEKLSEFSPSIGPMMVDFQTLAHIILTGEEREYFKEGVENFLDREVGEHESKILKYPFDRFKHLVETYPDITTSSISIQE